MYHKFRNSARSVHSANNVKQIIRRNTTHAENDIKYKTKLLNKVLKIITPSIYIIRICIYFVLIPEGITSPYPLFIISWGIPDIFPSNMKRCVGRARLQSAFIDFIMLIFEIFTVFNSHCKYLLILIKLHIERKLY